MKTKLLAALGLAALIQSCSSAVKLQDLAQSTSHSVMPIQGGAFPLQALVPGKLGQLSLPILRVYIEGDGHAWSTATQPSPDPTPHNQMVVQLALTDPTPAVYLGRPCQYIQNDRCDRHVWTSARFSTEVIQSMGSALDVLKKRYQAQHLELIGYSGGGAVALLLAEQRNDVVQVQTLAGNIDPVAWVALHKISPLTGSLDPMSGLEKLKSIPQRHLVGRADRIVPPSLAHGFSAKLQGDCIEVMEVEASHDSGWPSAWQKAQLTPIRCK